MKKVNKQLIRYGENAYAKALLLGQNQPKIVPNKKKVENKKACRDFKLNLER